MWNSFVCFFPVINLNGNITQLATAAASASNPTPQVSSPSPTSVSVPQAVNVNGNNIVMVSKPQSCETPTHETFL